MRLLVPTFVIILLTAALPADATSHEVDFVITFHADGDWTYDGPLGMLTPHSEETGVRYTWDLTIPQDAAVGEVRYTLDAFDLDRAKQLRPQLEGSQSGFPLFHYLARADIWNTDGPVQVYHIQHDEDEVVLRLQIPQTTDARLILERDVQVPEYTLGDVDNVTHFSFYQETRTEELSIGELQVRKAGTDGEWIRHPTPEFAMLQKFPVQGLDADTAYEVRAIFTDWSNNTVTSAPYDIHTRPLEIGTPPSFEILGPSPDAVLEPGAPVEVRVRVVDGETAVDPDSIRLFVDLEEQRGAFTFDDGVLAYTFPEAPAEGVHVVSVEAATLDGAEDHVKWSFQVGQPTAEATAPGTLLVLVLALLVGVLARRHPKA